MLIRAFVCLSLLLSSFAYAADGAPTPEQKIGQVKALAEAVRASCKVPDHVPNYALSSFERYVGQTVFPHLKMLNIAFLRGFNMGGSAFLSLGYCVIVFMGMPNDPYWESQQDFYAKAKKLGVLPERVFLGFDQAGAPTFGPTAKRN